MSVLRREAGSGHRAHLAKDRPLRPGPVVQTKDPADIGVGIRVSTIEKESVVEAEQGRIALLGRRRPLQHFLSPIHAHVVVHVPGQQHLPHRRVPVRVVGVGAGELVEAVDMLAAVLPVSGECLARPFAADNRTDRNLGVVWTKFIGELAPDDQLLQIGGTVFGSPLRLRAPPERSRWARFARNADRARVSRSRLAGMSAGGDIALELSRDEIVADAALASLYPPRKLPTGDTLWSTPQPREQSRDVGEVDVAGGLDALGGVARVLTAKRVQESVAQPQQFGAQCPRTDLRLGRGQLDGNDDIALDLQHAPPGFGRDASRRHCPLRTQVAAIADDERGSLRQAQRHIVGAAETDGKADPPLLEGPAAVSASPSSIKA